MGEIALLEAGLDKYINLEEVGVFSSKSEVVEYLLLKYLAQSHHPIGSWVLKVMLELNDLEVSTATIGRILKNLDTKQYTELVDSQGRVITEKGIAYVNKLSERVEREYLQKKLIHASQPKNLDELLDLLRARKALECETARLAASRAASEDIASIEKAMLRHEDAVLNKNDPTATALDFHKKVAVASKNRFLIAALDILIYEEVKLESQFTELITRERGDEYAKQHRLIMEAIKQQRPKEASALMGIHLDTLIEAIQEQDERMSKR
jgi:DNA-binding FadR family transcriptional regulator